MLPFEGGKNYIPAGGVSWREGERGCCATFCLARACLESWAGPSTALALCLPAAPGAQAVSGTGSSWPTTIFSQGWAELLGGRALLVFPALPQCLSLGVTVRISTWEAGGGWGSPGGVHGSALTLWCWWHQQAALCWVGVLGHSLPAQQRARLLCLLQPWLWVFLGCSLPCTSPRLLPWLSPATPALNLEFKHVLCP